MKVLRKRVEWANGLNASENQIRDAAARLTMIKTQLLALKTEIDADPDALQEDKDTMAQVANFVNHANWVNFINFVNNALNS